MKRGRAAQPGGDARGPKAPQAGDTEAQDQRIRDVLRRMRGLQAKLRALRRGGS